MSAFVPLKALGSAKAVMSKKSCAVNPLKSSAPLGAALAYLGMDRCLPLFHGSQGCTAFAMVLLVRHFKESIPVQTTAMNEITTILGGLDNVEQAILNIVKRSKPRLVGIMSTGLTETRGEDIGPELKMIKARNAEALDGVDLVYAATPDFVGGMQEGWAKAVSALIDAFVPEGRRLSLGQVNILPGVHFTPGDIEELRDMVESFGLSAVVLPDISGALDGHVPEQWIGTSLGGTKLEDVATMGGSLATLAFGEHMRGPAEVIEHKTGVPSHVIPVATGLLQTDALVALLSRISGRPVPPRLRRQRSQLADAMMDSHFYFGQKKLAVALEPDLLAAVTGLCADLGAEVSVAVSTTNTQALDLVPTERVLIGDMEDLETEAAAKGCDLLITHSHGRQSSDRTGIPLFRVGFPCFDRLGAQHAVSIGYRGTRALMYGIANLFLAQLDHHDHGHDADGHQDHTDNNHHGVMETGHGCAHAAAH